MYEYKYINVYADRLEIELTRYADDGWRVMKTWRIVNLGNYPGSNDWVTYECILEREKSNKQRRVQFIEGEK